MINHAYPRQELPPRTPDALLSGIASRNSLMPSSLRVSGSKIEPTDPSRGEGHADQPGYGGGYRIEIGGAQEESSKANRSIVVLLPLMTGIMLLLLMFQLQSFPSLFLVLATAPLGLIGAVGALLVFRQPFGFVALLGVLALAGMIMRNSVILVDQISLDRQEGHPAWEAVIDATIRRTRPVVLTALAAILAMIPLTRNVFWGPMAVAIMGGLLVATVLTLLFTPALYAMIFRIRCPGKD
ncbi:MAG: efflux RND transporter permease subunit [Solidesulfovibrio sp. DCME]|uniref:efflux RND transporter permease subunit n=1 Tax=Solidesulfovibrio sp. DCME TaxID=3447380 RepID=UPI003D0A5E87